jgi:lysophospholipid acyltransferase (LPLAT)-like uncharacterized protein
VFVTNAHYNIEVTATSATPAANGTETQWQKFTVWQRFLLWLITWAGFLVIRLLGPTWRFAVSSEEGSPSGLEDRPYVYSFWHTCMLPAMYLWRDLNIRVMSSDSFDGEYTGRIMQKFGFVKVRGSSSKGAVRALLSMRREIEEGWVVAFTIDGPRGPRYVAKPGPVILARATGVPMVVFHIAVDNAWILNTWDRLMIPKPFSRMLMRLSTKMPVPGDASEAQRERYFAELQDALDRTREFAEANLKNAGSPEFPFFQRKVNRDQRDRSE